MELSVDAKWVIFQITQDLNTYFRKRLVDIYLELRHRKRRASANELR